MISKGRGAQFGKEDRATVETDLSALPAGGRPRVPFLCQDCVCRLVCTGSVWNRFKCRLHPSFGIKRLTPGREAAEHLNLIGEIL